MLTAVQECKIFGCFDLMSFLTAVPHSHIYAHAMTGKGKGKGTAGRHGHGVMLLHGDMGHAHAPISDG